MFDPLDAPPPPLYNPKLAEEKSSELLLEIGTRILRPDEDDEDDDNDDEDEEDSVCAVASLLSAPLILLAAPPPPPPSSMMTSLEFMLRSVR